MADPFPAVAQTEHLLADAPGQDIVASHPAQVKGVRFESHADYIQVVVDLEEEVPYGTGRLANPPRLYFDLLDTWIGPEVKERQILLDNTYVRRIGIAQNRALVTRIVLDLNLPVRESVRLVSNPPRLVVELKGMPAAGETAQSASRSNAPQPVAPVTSTGAASKSSAAPREPSPEVTTAARSSTSAPTPPTPLQSSSAAARAGSVAKEPTAKPVKPVVLPPTLRIPRVSRPPKLEDFLDGTSREAEVRVTDFRQREPGDGTPVSEETSAYLSYDNKNLYVVFVCKDEPGKVRARMVKREDISDDDQVAVYLDTFRDRQRAYLFATNPLGIQSDAIITEGEKPDFSFDTLWYSEGRLTAQGFVVWMAIPFKSLRFSDTPGQTWGIALGRFIFRKNEDTFWPYITNRIEGFAQQMATLEGLRQISPGRNVQLIPYGTFTRSRFLDSKIPAFRRTDEGRPGMDAKIVLRDALTFDLTVNPDFSQVESDEPQVTINERFEVFFREKRPFFIENAPFFQTPVNLFFSRRVADPEFGARLTGKVGRWAIGALAIDDRAPGKRVPQTDPLRGRHAGIGVVRVKREFGEQSSIGVLATSRDFASSSDRVLSLDTRLKLSPNWVFTGQMIHSYTRQLDGQRLSGPASLAELFYGGRHFTYAGTYEDRSPNFRAPLGFIQRVDIRQTEQSASYLWRPEGRRVLSFGPSVSGLVNWDRQGRVQDWFGGADFRIFFTGATQVRISRSESFTLFENRGFRESGTNVSLFTQWLNWLGFSAAYSQGTNVNFFPPSGLAPFLANSENGSLGFTIRPMPRLRFDQTYLYSRLGTRQGSTPLGIRGAPSIFNDHLLRSKVNYQFSRALSLRAIFDYNAVLPNDSLVALQRTKSLTADFLLTYLLNPGTALYIGYTNSYENLALDPTMPPSLRRIVSPTTSTGRQFFVKVSYLLRF